MNTHEPPKESPLHIYANSVFARSGPYDIVLDFGNRVGAEEPDYQVRISMSWEHATSLIQLLQQLVESFEDQIGPLPDISKHATLDVKVASEGEQP